MERHPNFNREKFVSDVAENAPNESVRNALYELLEFGEKNAEELRNGRSEVGSIHYAISVWNKTVNLLTFTASGYVTISFGNFSLKVPRWTMTQLSNRLKYLTGFENVRNYGERPGFYIGQTIVDSELMERFQAAVIEFQAEIQQ